MANRNTLQLSLTREALMAARKHPTADDVYACLICRYPSISKSTVYNNLAKLAEQGEIVRLDGVESATRYDTNTAPHYHFQCAACGNVTDVDMPYIPDIYDQVRGADGFTFTGHTVLFTGLCPECKGKESGE